MRRSSSVLSFRRAVVVAATLLPLLQGCFFDTRDPRPTDGELCFETSIAETPQILFANLEGSLICLQAATYEEQLTEDFEFVPSSSVAQEFPDRFAEAWGVEQERSFVNDLGSVADEVTVTLRPGGAIGADPERILTSTGTFFRFESEYELTTTTGSTTAVFEGRVIYEIVQVGVEWKLQRWEELGATNPLGRLRATTGG